jgi:hypothetical protein
MYQQDKRREGSGALSSAMMLDNGPLCWTGVRYAGRESTLVAEGSQILKNRTTDKRFAELGRIVELSFLSRVHDLAFARVCIPRIGGLNEACVSHKWYQ